MILGLGLGTHDMCSGLRASFRDSAACCQFEQNFLDSQIADLVPSHPSRSSHCGEDCETI